RAAGRTWRMDSPARRRERRCWLLASVPPAAGRNRILGSPRLLRRSRAQSSLDRNEIIFALELQPVTADVNERDGIRPGIGGFLQKIAESAAQGVLVKMASASHIEAGCLEGLWVQPRIVCTRVKDSLWRAVSSI